MLCPLPLVQVIVGQGGNLTIINCPNIQCILISLQKVGFDTHSVAMQYTERIAMFETSFEAIKFFNHRDSLFQSNSLKSPSSVVTGAEERRKKGTWCLLFMYMYVSSSHGNLHTSATLKSQPTLVYLLKDHTAKLCSL